MSKSVSADYKQQDSRYYEFKLYITGKTQNSEAAIKNLNEVFDTHFNGKYELEIIDVLKNPKLVEDEKILATPCLDRELPLPKRRIVGDFSDKNKVLLDLELIPV